VVDSVVEVDQVDAERSKHKRQWRDYQTEGGTRPVREFLFGLAREDQTAILAEMEYVRINGRSAARHLQQGIYEVRITHNEKAYRILFACEGYFNHILLSLEGFQKKTQQTPKKSIRLAEQRLADWRRRGNTKN
jgi:phage-related protein